MRRLLRVVSAIGWKESRITSGQMDFLRWTLRSYRQGDKKVPGAALDDLLEAASRLGVDMMWVARAESGQAVENWFANLSVGIFVKRVDHLPS